MCLNALDGELIERELLDYGSFAKMCTRGEQYFQNRNWPSFLIFIFSSKLETEVVGTNGQFQLPLRDVLN